MSNNFITSNTAIAVATGFVWVKSDSVCPSALGPGHIVYLSLSASGLTAGTHLALTGVQETYSLGQSLTCGGRGHGSPPQSLTR